MKTLASQWQFLRLSDFIRKSHLGASFTSAPHEPLTVFCQRCSKYGVENLSHSSSPSSPADAPREEGPFPFEFNVSRSGSREHGNEPSVVSGCGDAEAPDATTKACIRVSTSSYTNRESSVNRLSIEPHQGDRAPTQQTAMQLFPRTTMVSYVGAKVKSAKLRCWAFDGAKNSFECSPHP